MSSATNLAGLVGVPVGSRVVVLVLEHYSIIDTVFEARMKGETMISDKRGIVATVTGLAYIMGLNQIVLDPNDPLPDGFHL